ncbi:MAG TPA: hypothetical protein VG248_03505 [Caulobacteraceae bacterium]|jgi:hypothetical protein|nr:hypothetical protein [Caulobacteraceae bacterium]
MEPAEDPDLEKAKFGLLALGVVTGVMLALIVVLQAVNAAFGS